MMAVLVFAHSGRAVSTYMGIQPGKSTRSDVEKAFGAPVNSSGQLVEYRVPGGSGQIFVEYREDNVVERLERRFAKPISRAALIRSLELPATADESGKNKEGNLVEYFGDIKTLAFVFASPDAAGGVISIGYYSMELYARSLDKARNPSVQFDPAACRDIFTWTTIEREPAKKSKNIGRYQAIIELGIVSQRGECDKARQLQADYKQRYP